MKTHTKNRPRALEGKTISPESRTDGGNSAPGRASKKVRSGPRPGGATINRKTAEPGSSAMSAALIPTPTCQSLSIPAKGLSAAKVEEKDGKWVWNVADLKRSFGTDDEAAVAALFVQILNMTQISDPARSLHLDSALAMIHEIAPKDPFERSFALQSWAVQRLAAKYLAKAADPKQTDEQGHGHVNTSMKLLRVYSELVEALDRHRGKVPQQMVVGNVLVADGGRAIVGPVNQTGPGKEFTDDAKQTGEEPNRGQTKRLVEKR